MDILKNRGRSITSNADKTEWFASVLVEGESKLVGVYSNWHDAWEARTEAEKGYGIYSYDEYIRTRDGQRQ